MKAKEFVRVLWDLHQTILTSESMARDAAQASFVGYAAQLHRECLEPHRLKLEELNSDKRRQTPGNQWEAEFIHVYKIASVKWNAVAHGLAMRTADKEEIFPYIQGGLIVGALSKLHTDMNSGNVSGEVARAIMAFHTKIAEAVGLPGTRMGSWILGGTQDKVAAYIRIGQPQNQAT